MMTMSDFWRIIAKQWLYRLFKDKSNLDNSGLFDHITDSEPIYFPSNTGATTPFGATGYGSGSTGFYSGTNPQLPEKAKEEKNEDKELLKEDTDARPIYLD
jgi:hypothetical protein